jgi:RNA polymerase-interacting CarD/CdnL/TRCF family regulator
LISFQEIASGKSVPKSATECDALFQSLVEATRKRRLPRDVGVKLDETARQADTACKSGQFSDAARLMASIAQVISQHKETELSPFQKQMLDKVAKRRAEVDANDKTEAAKGAKKP